MQLKGLVRFFTILLILYSVYEISITWFIRGHEKKMEARAKNFVKLNYPETPEQKARRAIDADLTAAGWLVQDLSDQAVTHPAQGLRRVRRVLQAQTSARATADVDGAQSRRPLAQLRLR